MKKFKCVKPQNEVVKSMRKLGYRWTRASQIAYDQGSDYNCFINTAFNKVIMVNTFNGRFYVKEFDTNKLIADESSEELDNVRWYSDLLDAIMQPLDK